MTMEQLYFLVDIDRCWGCKTCQVACKQTHGLPAGSGNPVEVCRVETVDTSGIVSCDFLPVACQHCQNPACKEICPKDAISIDENGLVQVMKERCIGCGLCVKACKYGTIYLQGKHAIKCDLCKERRDRGLMPSCEQHCLGGVFHCCNEQEKDAAIISRRYSWSVGRVVFLSDIKALSLS